MTDADAKVIRDEVRQAILTTLYELEGALQDTPRPEVKPIGESVSRALSALCRRWGRAAP